MASAGPLKWVMNFFSSEDDEELEMDEPTPQAPQPSTPQKRQRGPLTLHADGDGGMEIRHPHTLEDRMAIGMDLKQRRMVTLDLTHLPDGDARYFLEFVYGVVFALDATAEKVTEGIYLLAPHGVAVRNDVATPTESPLTAPAILPTKSGTRTAAAPRDGQQEELFWQAR